MKATYAFLVTGLAAQQAVATWNFFDKFVTPTYNANQCTSKEQSGFDWSDLQIGQSNFQYGDFDFSKGWSCSNSLAKRDHLTKRTFGNKVIKNRCSKQKPATFGCGQKKKTGFSITDMDISVEYDVDLEFRFTMTDGSKCKQYSKCSAGGTTVKNTQCGGAVSVDIYIGTHFQGSKNDCEIGFHNIGFDCNSGTTYTPPKPPQIPASSSVVVISSSAVISSAVVSSTPVATPTGGSCNGDSCKSSAVPVYSSAVPPTGGACVGDSCKPSTTPAAETSAPVSTPAVIPPYSAMPPYNNHSVPINTPIVDTKSSTLLVQTSTPLAQVSTPPAQVSSPPVQNSTPLAQVSTPAAQVSSSVAPPPGQTYPASMPCGAGQSCDATSSAVAVVSSSAAVVASSDTAVVVTSSTVAVTSIASPVPSTPSYPPVSPPDVLPKCMNSWLQISTKCKDNSDKDCYCINAEFTKNVIDCVSSWCGTDEETRQSLQFFIGICAEHVPKNPKIVEDCPPYIPLNPPTGGAAPSQPAAIPSGGAAPSQPVVVPSGGAAPSQPAAITSMPAGQTSVPAPPPAGMPYTTITYGTTSITVPQVHFTTEAPNVAGASPTAPVALMPGNGPAQVPATTTSPGVGGGAPYPIPSTMGTATYPAASGTGAIRPSSPAQFTGAASPFALVPQHALLGAALAFFAL